MDMGWAKLVGQIAQAYGQMLNEIPPLRERIDDIPVLVASKKTQ